MSDFLSREADLFGGEFGGSSNNAAGSTDIDFDAAASAFPDISLDGDVPSVPVPPNAARTDSGFSFDSFDVPKDDANVKITGDDELEQFQSQFPEVDVPQVCWPIHIFFRFIGTLAVFSALARNPLTYCISILILPLCR